MTYGRMKRRSLAYAVIADTLRGAIEGKLLPDGIVLLEGPIATLFSSSRSPVKQALAALEEEGLVRRFEGRGVLAGREGCAIRQKVTAEMLGLEENGAVSVKTFSWQACYYDFEQAIILRAVFGSARINELALARHYGVGRSVASDMLHHATRTGLVTVDAKARWIINPLDECRFRDLYELRVLLEPVALRTAIERVPVEVVGAMRDRLMRLACSFPNVEPRDIDSLEEDLHVDLLQFGTNGEVLEALKRTHSVLVAGKHIQRAIRRDAPIDAFMGEHMEVLDAILRDDARGAEVRLSDHLVASGHKAQDRLQRYLRTNDVPDVPFVLT